MRKEPHHFTWKDFLHALVGSFIVSMTFMFKGATVDLAVRMKAHNVILVIALTSIIVSIEIYALSYKFVANRKERPFLGFWAKRFFAIMISSFVSIYMLIYVYGINQFLNQATVLKLTSAILLPAAIAGAAVEMLKKK